MLASAPPVGFNKLIRGAVPNRNIILDSLGVTVVPGGRQLELRYGSVVHSPSEITQTLRDALGYAIWYKCRYVLRPYAPFMERLQSCTEVVNAKGTYALLVRSAPPNSRMICTGR